MSDILKTLGLEIGKTTIGALGNIGMWHLNNRYNHPKRQIQRMKEAGLNPALMYPGGGGGIAGNTSSGIQPTDKMDLSSWYNIQNIKKTGNLIDKQIRNKDAEESLLLAQASANLSGSAKADAERMTLNYMRKISGDAMEADTKLKLQQIKESKSRIANAHFNMIESALSNDVMRQKAMQENINLEVTENILKNQLIFEQFKARMAKNNININDEAWQRHLSQLIEWIIANQKLKKSPKNIKSRFLKNSVKTSFWETIGKIGSNLKKRSRSK